MTPIELEVEAAYRRFTTHAYTGSYAATDVGCDKATLASAYVRVRKQQAAEAAERAKPIDREWLRPLCVSVSTPQELYWYLNEDLHLTKTVDGWDLEINHNTILKCVNRGHVLDAMKLFNINQ